MRKHKAKVIFFVKSKEKSKELNISQSKVD